MHETDISDEEYLASYLVADPANGHSTSSQRTHEARYRFAAGYVPAGGVALDIGCATGYGSALLAERAGRVLGMDIAAPAVAEAARRHPDPRFHFFRGDATRLELEAGSVDVIACFDVIEHLERPVELLDELRRVLRPGGVAVLSTPNKLVSDLTSGQIYEFHRREYYLSEFEAELTRGGFAGVELWGQYATYVDDMRNGFGIYRRRSRFWFVPAAVRRRVPTGARALLYRSMGLGVAGDEPDQVARMTAITRERIDVAHDFIGVCRVA